MTKIEQLIHNGVLLSEIPSLSLSIEINGKPHKLTQKQEEMAIAWVRKLSTVYVDDPVFCKNFFQDFGEELGNAKLTDEDIDFSEIIDYVEKQKEIREAKTKEQKKQEREERKVIREQLKEKYGIATLDGAQVEISNYTAEPSSIFMGRGEHPMRGKWKEGPSKADIVLNLSPEVPRPEGEWKEIVWEPECLWIAKWIDKLSEKTKYVWLSDTTPIKQDREIEKYDKANLVGDNLEAIRKQTLDAIKSEDKRIREIATACYIIDHLNIRVGDEKDEDEADTVGATTLRPEHVKISGLNVAFNFLGKDSVEWNKEGEFPEIFVTSLQELIDEANKSGDDKPQIFSDIGSRQVNAFLGEIVEGLTAKVFRTYHATTVVQNYLDEADIDSSDADFAKKEAAVMANREAAIVCTHKKQEPKNWDNRIQRFRERKLKGQERIGKAEDNQTKSEERLDELQENLKLRRKQVKEQEKHLAQAKDDLAEIRNMPTNFTTQKEKDRHKKAIEKANKKVDSMKKKVIAAEKRVETAKGQVERGKNSLGTTKERVYKAKQAFKKIESQEKISKKTKIWNLGTSLKSYIDPRVYFDWGKEVDYDWRNYYSNTLQKKFSWVERDENE
ncbi:MAG: DNA topoisomerase I [Candidatus Heimdallarchaeota archaeon]|nr:DNA topoisomerase I [Candidatus Heimdallarchaeota archaeon]